MRTYIGRFAGLLGLGAVLPGSAVTAAGPVPPTTFGINLSPPVYFLRNRMFANLMIGSKWGSKLPGHKMGPEDVDPDGNLKQLPGGREVLRVLNIPNTDGPLTIRCTYEGRGTIAARNVKYLQREAQFFSFRWEKVPDISNIGIVVSALDAADPIRNIDCREATIPATARFDPVFEKSLEGFKVVRFMDWMNTNSNQPVTWATRHTAHSVDTTEGDGVAIEDMIAVAKLTGAEPWFNMPWNADDDYIAHFAKFVHDTMPPDRKIYVELSNEVWNGGFPASRQASQEGLAAKLSDDPNKARLFRYSQRAMQVMDIWTKAFADRPARLVRVLGSQNSAYSSSTVLGYEDTAQHIDALATAPYFGYDFAANPPADVDAAFGRVPAAIDKALAAAVANRAVAARYGKRYITYEAGQHIVLKDIPLAQSIQRDPRMQEAYQRYIDGWRAQVGDMMVLFNSVGPISRYGAFGMAEYLGQPLADAPKLRAVRAELAR